MQRCTICEWTIANNNNVIPFKNICFDLTTNFLKLSGNLLYLLLYLINWQ